MRNLFLSGLTLLLFFSCSKSPQQVELIEGISFELAEYRHQNLQNVHYELDFKVPKEKKDPVPANLVLSFAAQEITQDLQIDFNASTSLLKTIKVNDESIEIQHQKEHIIIPEKDLKTGENSITISFDLGEQSLNRNNDFLYTLLVPDRASTLIPCFDQPNIKATYQLNVTAPKDWSVLTGAFEEKQVEKGEFTEHQFQKTDPMSTYLFSFVVGNFQVAKKNPGAFDMTLLYKETNEEKIQESVDSIFSIHQKSLDFLEEYTQLPFPYQKMDFAAIPGFQYGGMEHVGAIQYRESSLFFDKTATKNRRISRAKLIAHETSHMWFGDWVTMRWFNDVWMKEVFANFMADKIINTLSYDEKFSMSFMMNHYPSAYSEDRTAGTNPIRQQLDNLKNAGSLYGRIIYNKAPIMMRQLEAFLGEETFQKGIQEYMKTYGNSNADWNDLISIFDASTEKDVKAWSEVWVNSSGRPVITDQITYEEGKIKSFTIQQKAEDGSDKLWSQSFQIGLLYGEEVKVLDVQMQGESVDLKAVAGLQKPDQIIYNYDAFGYGIFPSVNKDISKIQDDVARGYTYINLFENMLDGNVSPKETFELYSEGISNEKNELILNYISSRTQQIFWKFFNKEERESKVTIMVMMIETLMKKGANTGIQRTLFRLYQSIAYSPYGKETLYQFWTEKQTIPNLKLNENDFISLASRLAIFEYPKAEEVLKTQQEKIKNKQAKERFVWLLPSLSNDENIRDEFMNSLRESKNREKEPWVIAAMNNMHHPLRQASGIKHVKMSLDLLEEIQLTGDIFFPKRWLVSSIGNYTSLEAYQILQTFLEDNPDFSAPMKRKLLQSTDDLKRAQNMVK